MHLLEHGFAKQMRLNDHITRRTAEDPEFRAELEALRPEIEFRSALINGRVAAGFTQAELAERVGTRQPAIARLESGGAKPSFDTLLRLSSAFNRRFEITPQRIAAHTLTAPA
jgi:DNA-binding XRE family transcriptional regulator